MSFLRSLWLPKKFAIAGWVMVATLELAVAVLYYTGYDPGKIVKTVFYYLVLDYLWAMIRREGFRVWPF